MPYALIPDGYSLKKVTTLQKQALTDKRRHDNVMALLNNENTPLVVGGVIAGLIGAHLAGSVIDDLQEEGVQLTDDVKEKIQKATNKATTSPLAGPLVQGLRLFELPSKKEIEKRLRDLKLGELA
mgnify:CR=1 FL=1|tara:strand:- start:44 stop:418 length:375 start_codon:yes stop_codon:yes gene_type:complete